jgi:hypothetical protein
VPRFDVGATDPTGAADTTAALQAVIQPADRQPASAWGDTRHTVELQPGARFRISSQLQITRRVHIRGNGAEIFCESALCDMLRIQASAPGTLIEGLTFRYRVASVQLQDNDRTAVKVEAFNTQLRDVEIDGAGYGLVLDASAPGTNLNWFFAENVSITNSRRRAHYAKGLDASGGVFVGVRTLTTENHFDSANHFGPAIAAEESSNNGNTYVGCLWEVSNVGLRVANTSGPNPSVFVGCYVEGADPIEWVGNFATKTTVIGGILGRREDVKGDRVGAQMSRLTFRAVSNAGIAYTVAIPGADQDSAMWFAGNDAPLETWLLKRATSGTTHDWNWQNYLTQGRNTISFHVKDLGGGSYEVAGIVASS